MHYQEFVNRVNERIQKDMQEDEPGETEFAIRATLATVGECVSGKEADNLAFRLPAELTVQLESGNYAEEAKSFSLDEFYRRIADREGAVSIERSSLRARAVVTALCEKLTSEELTVVMRRLPEELESLSAAASLEADLDTQTALS